MRLIKPVYLFLVVLFVSTSQAADPVYQNGGVAVGGFDVVSYHRMQNPVEGSSDLTHEWQGVTWRFADETNLRLFQGDPEKFAPKYGGYCAYALARGALAPTDPEAWTIYHGKLYLNFSKAVREKWLADVANHVATADNNWPAILDE